MCGICDAAKRIVPKINVPDTLSDELTRELHDDRVRRDCAFCGYERVTKDDNHAPSCPYWTFFYQGGSL